MANYLELLTPRNSQLLFIDQQPQMAFGVQSIDRQALKNNVVALAKAGKVFGVPTTVTTVETEGFSGNIALKTAEGTAKQISEYLRAAMQRSWVSKLGALLASGGFRVLKEKMDPRRANGGTFLGLNGIAVKSHGGTDALGFASAVDLAYEMAQSRLIPRLAADLTTFHHKLEAAAAS